MMNSRARFQNREWNEAIPVEIRRGPRDSFERVAAVEQGAAPNAPSRTRASGFRTLLVPLDGSAFAEHALPRALAIARRSGASIRLAHVYSPLATAEPLWRREFLAGVDRRLVSERQAYLTDVARRIALRDSLRVVTILSESEQTALQLGKVAQGADLVVMATHGWGRLGRFWHGST